MKIFKHQITINDFKLYLLIIFVFLLPFDHYINSYVLGVWVFSSALNRNFFKNISLNSKTFSSKIIIFLVLALYFILILSLFQGGDIDSGINSLIRKLSFLLMPIVLFSNVIKESSIKKILVSFILGVFISSLICIVLVLSKHLYFTNTGPILKYEVFENYTNGFIESIIKRNSYFTYSFLSHFLHPTYFTVYIIFSIGIVYFFLRYKMFSGFNKIYPILLIVYFLLFLILLNVRASFISIIFLLFSVIIYESLRNRSKLLIILLMLVLFTFTVSVLTNDRIKSNYSDLYETIFSGLDSDKKYDDRIYIWRGSVSVISDNFWFGTGISKSDQYLKESFQEQGYKQGVKEGFNSHNQFLDLWLEIGIFGFLIFVSVFVTAFVFSIRERSFLLFLFCGIIFINLLFESMLNRFAGVSFFTLFLFLLIIRINISKEQIVKE